MRAGSVIRQFTFGTGWTQETNIEASSHRQRLGVQTVNVIWIGIKAKTKREKVCHMYDVVIEKSNLRTFKALDRDIQNRILDVVDELKTNRKPTDHPKAKPMQGGSTFRVRVGNYRLIMDKEYNKLRIWRVGRREDIYSDVETVYNAV